MEKSRAIEIKEAVLNQRTTRFNIVKMHFANNQKSIWKYREEQLVQIGKI